MRKSASKGSQYKYEEMKRDAGAKLKLMIKKTDHEKIQDILTKNLLQGKLPELEHKLARLKKVDSTEISSEVISMNSQAFILDHDTSESYKIHLVYQFSPLHGTQASILSPLGSALLGSRKNQEIVYKTRDNEDRKIRILDIL